MQMLLFISGWVVMCVGMHIGVSRQSEHDLEQASLLPFADDPDADRIIEEILADRKRDFGREIPD